MFKNATYGGSSVMVAQEFVALLDWFQIPTSTPKLYRRLEEKYLTRLIP